MHRCICFKFCCTRTDCSDVWKCSEFFCLRRSCFWILLLIEYRWTMWLRKQLIATKSAFSMMSGIVGIDWKVDLIAAVVYNERQIHEQLWASLSGWFFVMTDCKDRVAVWWPYYGSFCYYTSVTGYFLSRNHLPWELFAAIVCKSGFDRKA